MKRSKKITQSHFDFLFCYLNLSSLLCQSQVDHFQSWDQTCHHVTLRALEVLVFSLRLRRGIALLQLQHPHHLQLHTVFHWHRIYLQTHLPRYSCRANNTASRSKCCCTTCRVLGGAIQCYPRKSNNPVFWRPNWNTH